MTSQIARIRLFSQEINVNQPSFWTSCKYTKIVSPIQTCQSETYTSKLTTTCIIPLERGQVTVNGNGQIPNAKLNLMSPETDTRNAQSPREVFFLETFFGLYCQKITWWHYVKYIYFHSEEYIFIFEFHFMYYLIPSVSS